METIVNRLTPVGQRTRSFRRSVAETHITPHMIVRDYTLHNAATWSGFLGWVPTQKQPGIREETGLDSIRAGWGVARGRNG